MLRVDYLWPGQWPPPAAATQATTELVGRLAQRRPDALFVDAPVSGTKGPAENGQLLILASGPAAAEPTVRPVFAAIGRKTLWLGDAGRGSATKVVLNAYMSILIEGVAEALVLADRLDVDAGVAQDAMGGGDLLGPEAGRVGGAVGEGEAVGGADNHQDPGHGWLLLRVSYGLRRRCRRGRRRPPVGSVRANGAVWRARWRRAERAARGS
ncbi:NAD(P)-binding domain-containing protein [Dactylosporangium salmoneum]|uniref:NAD(P)-binding domain-containing protein n=1 Tax=Dactylosporangium salmoneum TaxID=53361 RepID=UPI003CD06450